MSHRSFIRRILCAVLLAVSALFAVIGCQQEQTEPPTASASQETTQEEATMSRTESAETTTAATETVTETVTESETDAPTEAPTEPETDPVREALERSVSVVPYIPAEPSRLRDVKAMWLSQFDLNKVYTNGGRQRAEDDFRNRIAGILQNVADNGFNTVIVQVRPNADSFYPSDLYAPSAYVTGSYANDFTYDPFSILIEEARARGLSVHAWINPLRGVTTSELQKMAVVRGHGTARTIHSGVQRTLVSESRLRRGARSHRVRRTGNSPALRCGRHPHGRLLLPHAGRLV